MKKQLTYFILFIVLTSFSSINLFASNYYIANNGDDTNNGKSPSKPWKTIDPINKQKFIAGDSILFKCGDIFSGEIKLSQSGTSQKNIVIASYGTGKKPVLTGAVEIKNWQSYKGNIKKAKVNSKVYNLFANNNLQIAARYPNTGFLTFGPWMSGKKFEEPNNQFIDNTLEFPNGYWDGCKVRYRPIDWEYGYSDIVSFANHTFTLKDSCRYGFAPGYGYFLEGNIEQLDMEKEWIYDSKTKDFYFWSTGQIEQLKIEGVVYNNCIQLLKGVSFVSIKNLVIEKYETTGILGIANNTNIAIENCSFLNIDQIGIRFNLISKSCSVRNCILDKINGRGISFYESEDVLIERNRITNIGMQLGYGITGVNGMTAIVVENIEEDKKPTDHIAKNSIIQYNYVDSVGHMGIRMDGTKSICYKNVVNNCNFHLNDGGSVYSWCMKDGYYYSYNNIFRGNLIVNSFGSDVATPSNGVFSQGIYLDGISDIVVDSNYVINHNGSGILINTGARNTVAHNFCYGSQTNISLSETGRKGNVINNNFLFARGKTERNFSITNWTGEDAYYATMDHNIYYSLDEKYVCTECFLPEKKELKRKNEYTLELWKTKSGEDKNSICFGFEHELSKFKHSVVIFNDTFESKKFDMKGKYVFDLNGKAITESITLAPLTARVLLKE